MTPAELRRPRRCAKNRLSIRYPGGRISITWYEFLLFLHITAAVIWLGGAFTFQMYGAVVRHGGDPEEIARFAGRAGVLGERMFVPASLLVVLAGVGLMIEGSWAWGELWVIFALVTFAASFVTGLFVIAPMAKKIPVVGPTTPAGQALIQRLFTILRIDLVYMYAIVFAMVVKPTGDDGWTIAIVAAVLVALTAVFLAPLRSTSDRPHSATVTD